MRLRLSRCQSARQSVKLSHRWRARELGHVADVELIRGQAEIGVIEQVEKFGAEFYTDSLACLKSLVHPEVQFLKARATRRRSRRIAQSSRLLQCIRSRIEPAVYTAQDGIVAKYVGAIRVVTRVANARDAETGQDRERDEAGDLTGLSITLLKTACLKPISSMLIW